MSLHAPYAAHLLGTTQAGEDVLSQVLTGIRLTLELGVMVGVIATILSVLVGVSAAYLGGMWDEILSLITNVFLVIPALPLLIILLGYLPHTGQMATILVLAGLGWPWGARVIRAQTLAIRGRDFVAAARETGESDWRIIAFEIVPNEVSLIAANFVNTVLYAIGASVALAFIGVTDTSTWSLGTILYWAQSQQALSQGAWWWFVPPGILVALMGPHSCCSTPASTSSVIRGCGTRTSVPRSTAAGSSPPRRHRCCNSPRRLPRGARQPHSCARSPAAPTSPIVRSG